MSSYSAEPRRSTRNQARNEQRALEDALALSLGNAVGTEDATVPSTPISRKRKVSEDASTAPPKKQKATRGTTTSPHGDARQKSSPRGQAKPSPTNAKVTKEPSAPSVSTTVKQWLQDGLYADNKDLQVLTERFAAKEASWIGQVNRGREKDHLIKPPRADMKYVYFQNGQPVLALGAVDAPYHPRPRKAPPKIPQEKKLARSPPKKDKPDMPKSLPGATTDSSTLPTAPKLDSSPCVNGGPLASDHHSASPATRRYSLRSNSGELVNVPVRNRGELATSSAMAKPRSSALFPPVQTVRVGFSFGPISALMAYRYRQDISNQESATQEEAFAARPSIKILVPDTLKGLLVDDWENITKNNQLVPIPHPTPVSQILEDYVNYEKPQRPENSASIDILEETIAGLKEYFDKSLGRILLYRFERAQYAEVREKWNPGGEMEGKSASETYGAEHLMRLMVSLPELIAQTNMDQQSVNRLREELSKFCVWLEKNAGTYFVSQYESPNAEYAEKAKN